MIIIVNKAPTMPILLNIILLSIFVNLIKVYCEPTINLHFIEKLNNVSYWLNSNH